MKNLEINIYNQNKHLFVDAPYMRGVALSKYQTAMLFNVEIEEQTLFVDGLNDIDGNKLFFSVYRKNKKTILSFSDENETIATGIIDSDSLCAFVDFVSWFTNIDDDKIISDFINFLKYTEIVDYLG